MSTVRELLCGTWSARPDIDDLLQQVTFREDGTGSVLSGGGQAFFLHADFTWTLEGDRRMALAFRPSSHPPVKPYRPGPGAERHDVAFRAEAGAFQVQVPALYCTATYRKRLVFEESPLPRDAAEYHRGSLFFTVVNQIDPRSFLEFYADMDPEKAVAWELPALPSWREALAGTKVVSLARLPTLSGGSMFRVIVPTVRSHGVLEARVQDGEQVVFFLPGTRQVAVRCTPSAGRTALPRLTVSEPYPGIRAHLRTVEIPAPLTPEGWVQAIASHLLTW